MLISVIIPVFNVENYLERCLDSVINQTYTKLEIIIVDDGSTDGSHLICLNYAKKDDRIKLFTKSNGGLSSARNFGIDNSNGDYLAFVDSDDYVDTNMFFDLLFLINKFNSNIASCARFKIFKSGNFKTQFNSTEILLFNRLEAIESFLLNKYFDASVCNKLFCKNIFSDLRFPLNKTCEDLFIFPLVVNKIDKWVHTGKSYYFYDYRENSISNIKFNKNRLDLLEAVLVIRNQFLPIVKKNLVLRFYLKHLIYLSFNILKSKSINLFKDDFYQIRKLLLKDMSLKRFIFSLDLKRKIQFLFILSYFKFDD